MQTERDKEKVLKERAEKLALVTDPRQRKSAEYIEVIHFLLGEEVYAVESTFVSEVYPLRDVTKLPGVPSFIYGIMNVRRRIVAIIDLANYFQLRPWGNNEQGTEWSGVILQDEENEFALLTTKVFGSERVSLATMQSPLPSLTSLQQEFIKGITSQGVVILNCARLLSDDGLKIEDLN